MPRGGSCLSLARGDEQSQRPRTVRRRHARSTARCRWPSSVARDNAWIARWTLAAQQGQRYPADPPTVQEIVAVMLARVELPVSPPFCVATGPTRGRGLSPAAARAQFRHAAVLAGVRRRSAPHQLRHAHAVEMAREGVPMIVIQRQLGHTNLGITSIHLQGIDNAEIIDAVHARRAPMIAVEISLSA